jgi:hypothetical protein
VWGVYDLMQWVGGEGRRGGLDITSGIQRGDITLDTAHSPAVYKVQAYISLRPGEVEKSKLL